MKLIIEPADGVGPLLAAIKSAKKSVDIAVFRFDRRDVEMALKAAAERGVKVTALIAFANRGGEQTCASWNCAAGWKGRGFWSSYSMYTPWHQEGGKGARPKVVKFQVRPTPLAK